MTRSAFPNGVSTESRATLPTQRIDITNDCLVSLSQNMARYLATGILVQFVDRVTDHARGSIDSQHGEAVAQDDLHRPGEREASTPERRIVDENRELGVSGRISRVIP